MTTKDNLEDIIEWDIPNWSVALDYWSKNTEINPSNKNALEIGSRNGGLSLWAALKGMDVLCTDVEGPTNEAIIKHQHYKISDHIKYDCLNALTIPYIDKFDVVLFKSVLGSIGRFDNKENQSKAMAEIYKSLKKGGELWFAENLSASPIHRFFRERCVEWGDKWRYVTVEEMNEFLAIFSEIRYITLGFAGCLGRTPVQRSILGNIDRIFADKLVPQSWHYVMIGIAKK